MAHKIRLDSTAVSIFVVMLVELTNTVLVFVFVNSNNMSTNIETAALSKLVYFKGMLRWMPTSWFVKL